MGEKKGDLSIRMTISIVFILATLATTGIIGSVIIGRWLSNTEEITTRISGEISDRIYDEINKFIYLPHHVNEANQSIIRDDIIDFDNEDLRDKYFINVLNSERNSINSWGYGTRDGKYYGARISNAKELQVVKTDSKAKNLNYYSLDADMMTDEIIHTREDFDPRDRFWYRAAIEHGGPVYYPTFKEYIREDLSISATWPIYDKSGELHGVLSTNILLAGIGDYLGATVEDYEGYALILEKDTGYLIANSMDMANFKQMEDGTLRPYKICEIENNLMQKICGYYMEDKEMEFIYGSGNDDYYVNARDVHMEGLDWVVISAIPRGLYTGDVIPSVYLTVFLGFLLLLISLIVYGLVTRSLFRPMNELLQVSADISGGDLSKRMEISRNDEIGIISESFNNLADKMQFYINNLEFNVRERTEELYQTNVALKNNQERLRIILNSTAEGIFGIDLEGRCTFSNMSAIKILGYNNKQEMLDVNIHHLIHHSDRNGLPINHDECKINRTVKEGISFQSEDEIFWRTDGTYFDVSYHSYPQIRDGQVIGAVVSFMDITERKKRDDEIRYLNEHDALTGLYNRRYFDMNRDKIDIAKNLPLSVIFGDINGLKMTNDIFGHSAGDELIKKSANIINKSCRDSDIVVRMGGDEFIILLPGTDQEKAGEVLARINKGFENAHVEAMKCSISLGSDTKVNLEESLEAIIANAEDAMYRDKTLNRRLINKDIIDNIIKTLHAKSPSEKRHSRAVAKMAKDLAYLLNLSQRETNRLERAAYLHDIGKIVLDEDVLTKIDLTEDEKEDMQQHPVIGYRILNLFDDTLDIAEYVYSHHEMWNGKGYPRGLKGEEIPLISRIISIIEVYDRVFHRALGTIDERKSLALNIIKDGRGKEFDPDLVAFFMEMMHDQED